MAGITSKEYLRHVRIIRNSNFSVPKKSFIEHSHAHSVMHGLCCCFCGTTAELSSCDTDHISLQA